jgi:hypothetical protein
MPTEWRERSTGFRQCTVQRREAQVVADRNAEAAPWQVMHDGELARPEIVRFAVALAVGEIDVEHVDLVVARDNLAARIDQEGAVGRLVGRYLYGQRSDVQPDRELARKLAEHGEAGVAFLRDDCAKQSLTARFHDVGHLGGEHVVRAPLLGLADQLGGGVQIGLRRAPGAHLDEAGAERRLLAGRLRHVADLAAAGSASSGSSLPASSSA